MDGTARLDLPFLSVGQAAKETVHNEALQALDILVCGAVEDSATNAPPSDAAVGSCYLISSSPTGDWAGKANHVAAFTAGGWLLLPPSEGMQFLIRSTGTIAAFVGGAWEVGQVRAAKLLINGQQVVGSREAAIASPSGGTTVDSQARETLDQILVTLRQHGLIET